MTKNSATGRTPKGPNHQQIPIRTEEGAKLKAAFLGEKSPTPKAAAPKKAATSSTKKSDPMAKTPATTNTGTKALSTGAEAVPDFMREFAGQGTDNISNTEVETPRLKLLQAISPEIESFDEAKVGHFWHSISEESLGAEVSITIIMVDQRYILWKPRHDGGGILARADDGIHWVPANQKFEVLPIKGSRQKEIWETKDTVAASGLAEWGSSVKDDPNSQPAATKMFNLLIAFNDRPDLGFGIVTLQRAGIRVARKLLGKLKITAAPSFGMKFIMSSIEEDGAEGPYRNYAFRADGFHQDAETFKFMKEAHDRFAKSGINIKDLEGAQDEGAAAGDGDGGGEAPKGGMKY